MRDFNPEDPNTKYDQYSHYDQLPRLLKRFSFAEKMRIANKYSSQWLEYRKQDLQGKCLPWCLETFVMLSVESKEYSDNGFNGNNECKFITMYNAIFNATGDPLKSYSGEFSMKDIFIATTSSVQFDIQECQEIKLYRYWTLFNDDKHLLNEDAVRKSGAKPLYLKDIFHDKFGTYYRDYCLLGYIIKRLTILEAKNVKMTIPQKAYEYLVLERFQVAGEHLVISRDEYIEKQRACDKANKAPQAYLYSLRPSYQFPFIEEDGRLYFPLPHLLIQSVTTALYYRLTENDDTLRSQIGKNILEPYLLKLLSESGKYDEIYPEQTYQHKGEARSPDVLARQGKNVLFVDSKSTVPDIRIRNLVDEGFKHNIDIVGENIAKLYRQIHLFGKYSPFHGETSENTMDYWGVVVVLEDAYIPREYYYEVADKRLNILDNIEEKDWLRSNIKVASLYEIERLSLSGNSIIDACQKLNAKNKLEYPFGDYEGRKLIIDNPKFKNFLEKLRASSCEIVREMQENRAFDSGNAQKL